MKHLTMKFREIFADYDYNSKDIHILTQLLDLVMSMMTVIDKDDMNYIQKLASFLKIFSSDFSVDILDEKVNCLDILNENIIDIIYENQILPIFVHFDQKYEYLDEQEDIKNTSLYYDTTSKELCGDVPEDIDSNIETQVLTKDNIVKFVKNEGKTSIAIQKIIEDIHPVIAAQVYETNNRGDPDENIGDYSKLFYILKSTTDPLEAIYNSLLSGEFKERDKILDDIQSIENSAKLSLYHPYKEIKELSEMICGLCKILIEIIGSDTVPPPTIKSVISLIFESINDIKYNFSIH